MRSTPHVENDSGGLGRIGSGLPGQAERTELRAAGGETKKAEEYKAAAKALAERWVKESSAGDHHRPVFDKRGSWRQK